MMNGSLNNQKHPHFCQSQIPLLRGTIPFYINNHQIVQSQYNPRIISNQLGRAPSPLILNPDNVTMALTIWAQFIDHDITLTPVNNSNSINIQIPKCDLFYDLECQGNKFIHFTRSVFVQSETENIEQMNMITGWIDGSMVYGSSDQEAHRLRSFENGKMKVKEGNFIPDKQGSHHKLPDAGDERAAENLLLLSYHTIFLRQHNRLCDIIKAKDPNMNDQQTYQAARNYVIGLIQKITFEDFLPIVLGKQGYDLLIGSYKGYNQNVDPRIMNEFSTAAYRFGHALLVGKLPLINSDEQIQSEMNLHQIFFRQDLMNQELLQKLMRGLTFTITKKIDGTIIDSIRNLLITDPVHREQNIHLDLFALNVQRARDHGIQKYNYLRKVFGLEPLRSFSQLTDDPDRAKLLNDFYHGNINQLDPWVGIINQKSVNGGILGELGSLLVGQTFKNLRDGDRFWYENILSHNLLPEIKGTFLSEIIIRNTNIDKLQENIFYYNTKYSRTINSN